MAKVVVTLMQDWRKIAELAGADPNENMFDPSISELEVVGVTQAVLNTAFATYTGDQANIDAATAAAREADQKEQAKDNFDSQKVLVAVAKLLIKELNTLRALQGLPDRTFAQWRKALRNEIDTG